MPMHNIALVLVRTKHMFANNYNEGYVTGPAKRSKLAQNPTNHKMLCSVYAIYFLLVAQC